MEGSIFPKTASGTLKRSQLFTSLTPRNAAASVRVRP